MANSMRAGGIAAFVAGGVLIAGLSATAQDAPRHVRGKVTAVTADSITVKTRTGQLMTVKMAPNFRVAETKQVTLSAIQPGSFVGTTTIEMPDGTGRSLEVHIFPPGVKMGAGHYPWDLKPGSMMTNGDVGKVVAGAKGDTIEVSYPGGSHTVLVPPKARIVETVPGDLKMIKPGVSVFMIAGAGPDGALGADAVVVGEKGAPPF